MISIFNFLRGRGIFFTEGWILDTSKIPSSFQIYKTEIDYEINENINSNIYVHNFF